MLCHKEFRMPSAVLLSLVVALAAPLAAQVISGSIQGVVTDAAGAVVPGAKVAARNVDTGVEMATRSNQSGLYFIGELRPGNYLVEATAEGFSRFVRRGLTLRVEDRLGIDIRLEIGKVTESVDVTSEAPLVETEHTTIGKVVEEQSIKQLPLSGRNAFALVLLTPGTQQRADDEQPRLSGGRARTGDFVLDGTSVTDPRRGETSYTPNLDAIQEFKVQTNGLAAEVGRTAGGIVNATLKSGTNQVHGNAFEFLRNEKLNARNAFASGVPKLAYNQFGGMIGGPIRRDRTFFFVAYEGLTIRNDTLFNLTLPLPEYKRGDFSSLLGRSVGSDALGRSVLQNQIFDPASTRLAPNGRQVRDPFPNNIIPTSRFDPAGGKVAALYADPNQPGTAANFRLLKPGGTNDNKFDSRVDHRFSSKDLFFTRVSWLRQESITPRPYEYTYTGGSPGQINRWLTGAVNWTRTLTPTTLNDVRFSGFRGSINRLLSNTSTSSLGIPSLDLSSLPRFILSGYDTIGDATDLRPTQEQYQIQDIATLVRGRHIAKFGADIRRIRVNDLQRSAGSLTLSRNQTADPTTSGAGHVLASLLLGQIDSFSLTSDRGRFYQRSTYMGLFAQDDFKIRRNLTLNIGVRYDVEQQPNETRWNGSNFDLNLGKVVTMRELGRNRIQLTDKNNFSPRVGFAWKPFGQKTVLRSHYGMFYLPLTGRATSAFNRFPQSQNVTGTAVGVTPAAVLSKMPPLVPSTDGLGTSHQVSNTTAAVGYFQQWNFDIQHQVSGDLLLQATYAASAGKHLPMSWQYNVLRIETVQTNRGGRQDLLPYPKYGDLTGHDERANSTYHSLQLSAEKRFSKGLLFLASFTWSKMIDDTEDNFGSVYPMDPYNQHLEKGLSQAHIPKRFVASAVYDLPFGKGKRFQQKGPLSHIVGGWQLSGILAMQAGEQVWIYQSNNTAQNSGRMFRPNLIANPVLPVDERTRQRWFNTAAFQAPAPLTFGNSNKTPGIQGPGQALMDTGLHRTVRLPFNEHTRIEFRAECFNCFNRVNLGLPGGVFGTSSFGVVSSSSAARTLQFALKFWY
jgi:hypothetical protein